MPTDPIRAELERLAALAERATPDPTLMRYAHGGGRSYVEDTNGGRTLVADYYTEGDREFYHAARNALPALVLALLALIDTHLSNRAEGCWCGIGHDFTRGHGLKCLAVRAALAEIGKGQA